MNVRTHARMHEHLNNRALDEQKGHGYVYYTLCILLPAILLIASYEKFAIRNQKNLNQNLTYGI